MPGYNYYFRKARGLRRAQMMYTAPYARQVQRVARRVDKLAGIINSELHYHDVALTSAISSTGTITSLSGIAQGDDDSGRTGRSLLAKSVEIRSAVAANASASASRCRVIVFADTMNQSSTPSVTEVLESASPEALRNLATDKNRFKVLMDKYFTVDPNSRKENVYKKFIKLGNHHIKYNGTTANDVGHNSLWMLTVSNEATNTPAQNTNIRLRYYDN